MSRESDKTNSARMLALEAEPALREQILKGTSSYLTYFRLSACCRILGKIDESINLLKRSLELNPNNFLSHYRLGSALKEKGDSEAAITCYMKAISLNNMFAEAYISLGQTLIARGEYSNALTWLKKVIKIDPELANAYLLIGNIYSNHGAPRIAIAHYMKALTLKKDSAPIYFNLGNAHLSHGEIDNAIGNYLNAIRVNTRFAGAYINLANCYQRKGDLNSSVEYYEKAININPLSGDAHANLSHCLLAKGDYKRGLEEYEWRDRRSTPRRAHASPRCERISSLEECIKANILIISEQGLGDTLQFIRYAIHLRDKGFSIQVCVQKKLHALIHASGICETLLVREDANRVDSGKWIPLLSVPKLLGVRPEKPIVTEPYIYSTEELTTKWARILGKKDRPIVGINWQGNPKIETGSFQGRSLELETFAKVANIKNISLLSLQKGFGSEQLDTCSFKDRFVSCQDQINETWDFLETAAIIANCDLVITSDTSMAHLSGAMGKITWLLLQKAPDWRWGLEGDKTFWYPSMRLFRQSARGNWNEVMTQVAEALQKHFGGSSPLTEITSAPKLSTKP